MPTSVDFDVLTGCLEPEAAERSRSIARAHPDVGGIVTFEGRVRNHHEGRSVRMLAYTAYEELAHNEGETILREAIDRFDLVYAYALHATGELAIGDMAVWVAAGAAHRDAAFAACRYVIDEIKRRLPVWKHEHYEDGTHGWIYCAH